MALSICDVCGTTLEKKGTCWHCPNCGWSACS